MQEASAHQGTTAILCVCTYMGVSRATVGICLFKQHQWLYTGKSVLNEYSCGTYILAKCLCGTDIGKKLLVHVTW